LTEIRIHSKYYDMADEGTGGAFEVSIRKSSRDYGYIFWKQSQDEDAKRFFGELTKIEMWIDGSHIGEKLIDWRARRIFVGVKCIRNIAKNASIFHLELCGD